MKPVEILDGLFFIQRGYLNANHFVFRSKRSVLIDTGYIADYPETIALITGLGVNLPDVQLIVGTHCHCDHIGGHHKIQALSGCDIALHKVGKYYMDTRNDWAPWWQYFNQDAAFFDCTIELNDGDELPIGPHEFTVIHTPGHAAEGIILYNRDNQILISADALWKQDMALINLRIEGSAAPFQMLESLERIEALDVRVVYPGHGEPFFDVATALARARTRLHFFLDHFEQIGLDLIKKMIVFTLMMQKSAHASMFFDDLMKTRWYKETVDLYFNGEYRPAYDSVMKDFIKRQIVIIKDNCLTTTVLP